MSCGPLTVDELADELHATREGGDGGAKVTSCATLEEAGPGDVSFFANKKYAAKLKTTRASAVIVGREVPAGVVPAGVALLRVSQPYLAFMRSVVRLHGHRRHPHEGIHPRAFVEPSATVGEGTVVYPFAYVGTGSVIGRNCVLHPGVVIYDGCVVGDRAVIHANSVIGQDGFGYATDGSGMHHKIPQAGNVVIGDDVEIGANCSIDRATLGSTVVGRGTKTSNAVTVGHGTKIGEGCLLVAQVGLAGSVKLGRNVTIAGQSAVAGHLTVGDGVTVAGRSGVTNDVPPGITVMGLPAKEVTHARRVLVLSTKLPELFARVKALEASASQDE